MSKPYLSQDAVDSMPKRPVNSYMIFRADNYDSLKVKNPDKTMTEITSIISQMWGDLDSKKKNEYLAKAEVEKKQYEEQYTVWLKKFKLDKDQVKEALKQIKGKRRTRRGKNEEDEEQEDKQMQKKAQKAKSVNKQKSVEKPKEKMNQKQVQQQVESKKIKGKK